MGFMRVCTGGVYNARWIACGARKFTGQLHMCSVVGQYRTVNYIDWVGDFSTSPSWPFCRTQNVGTSGTCGDVCYRGRNCVYGLKKTRQNLTGIRRKREQQAYLEVRHTIARNEEGGHILL